MYQIDAMSRTPVYEQIVNQTEKFVLVGVMKAGDKIPSVRNLAMELSVNPNTIQKALMELDHRGVIFSVPGKGSYIAENAREHLTRAGRKELANMRENIRELQLAGITRDEIVDLVDEVYREKEGNNHD